MQLKLMFISKTLLLAVSTAIACVPLALSQAVPAPAPVVPAKPATPLVPPPAAASPAPARMEASGISIRVEQPSKTDNDRVKKTVTRSLKVSVSNSSTEALELKVKYAFFGRDTVDKDIKILGEGDRPASVKPRSTEIVETNTATAVMNDATTDPRTRKRTPASGTKFVGYGVQVFNGEKLVAETYDPISIKDSWGKAPAAAPAPKAAPRAIAKPDPKKPGGLGL